MALTDVERLRQALGESIPVGGVEGDTLFTNIEIQDFLDRAAGDIALASYYGQVAKSAALANLVTTSEGQTRLEFSKLHDASLKQEKKYGEAAGIDIYVNDRSVTQRPIVRR